MNWMRRITLVVAMMTFVAYFWSDRLRAIGCDSITYFNYGYEAYGCGLYSAQGTACVDQYNDCFANCYLSLGSSYGGFSLDWCNEYSAAPPDDDWWKVDARCTCYVG